MNSKGKSLKSWERSPEIEKVVSKNVVIVESTEKFILKRFQENLSIDELIRFIASPEVEEADILTLYPFLMSIRSSLPLEVKKKIDEAIKKAEVKEDNEEILSKSLDKKNF